MYYFSEKFEFAATHTLWNEKLSEEENFDAFGKCANPAGHGHNYIVEVTAANEDGTAFGSGRFEGIRGKGTYVGRRVAPLSAGADGYIDLSSSYTMPPGTR